MVPCNGPNCRARNPAPNHEFPMARKKNRQPQQPGSGPSAAITTAPSPAKTSPVSLPDATNGAVKTAISTTAPAAPAKKKVERHWVEAWAITASRLLGSLQVAVILLALF